LHARPRPDKPYSISGLQHGLNSLPRGTTMDAPFAGPPCVHDLRRSFAVQALSPWYRHSAEAQAQLPRLTMYTGHMSIESTVYYRRCTDEIAALASARLAQHFAATIGSWS
jgi:hypothetical protein